MRTRTALLSLLVLTALVALPAAAQKTHIDFDGATAFNKYKSFQFREARKDMRRISPHMHGVVLETLREYMVDGGLAETDENPDVFVTYFVADAGSLEMSLTDLDYAYGPEFRPGSYWDGGVGTRDANKKTYVFREGTVIVDVWDREREILVWRGMATKGLASDYHQNDKKLVKALAKLMKNWEKMHGGRARALRQIEAEGDE